MPDYCYEISPRSCNNSWASFEEDNALRRLVDTNLPVYLPKWWDKIKNNDYDGNWLDP